MIKSFKQKELEKFFLTGNAKLPQFAHKKRVKLILDLLDAVTEADEMNFPGSNFHKLEPKTVNRFSVSVSGNWRICFVFINNNASNVEYIDYH